MAKDIIVSLQELEERSMPGTEKMARDYWQSGANDLFTLRENMTAYDRYRIRPRVMRNVTTVSTEPKKLLGHQYSVPIGIAPSAFHQMAHPEGECATAAACKKNNWPMGLSSYSNRSLAEVKAAGGDSPVFLQLYVFKNKKTSERLVKWAESEGYKAVLLTVDTPYLGRRYLEMKNDFQLPSHLKLGNFNANTADGPIDIASESTSASRKTLEEGADSEAVEDKEANVIDPGINWDETIPWLRSITNMEIWVKGVVTGEDTEAAIAAGVDGIWVSNHGGRQLDGGLATIDALPEVVEAARGRVPIHIDGGIRKGTDVFKALALGADFVWLGRPAIYGLKYNGQEGVELMQKILVDDFLHVMALAGCRNVSEINRSCLVRVGPALTKL